MGSRRRFIEGRPWGPARSAGLVALSALLLSACAGFPPAPTGPPSAPEPVEPVPQAEPAPPPPAPPPPPVRQRPPAPPEPAKIAVLVTGEAAAYRDVAAEIESQAGEERTVLLSVADERAITDALFGTLRDDGTEAIIAVGLSAARRAGRQRQLPVVFCQVFDVDHPDLAAEHIRGVQPLPPLDRQLAEWRSADPDLKTVGALLGPGHEWLVAEAESAARHTGMALHLRRPTSDREALYVLRRMAPDIDGLWLFPDNRILSPGVIREMLDYAQRRGIRVVVFSPALLDLGAFMSATSVTADIAAVAIDVAERIAAGDPAKVAHLTPLTMVQTRINARTATRLGVTASAPAAGVAQ